MITGLVSLLWLFAHFFGDCHLPYQGNTFVPDHMTAEGSSLHITAHPAEPGGGDAPVDALASTPSMLADDTLGAGEGPVADHTTSEPLFDAEAALGLPTEPSDGAIVSNLPEEGEAHPPRRDTRGGLDGAIGDNGHVDSVVDEESLAGSNSQEEDDNKRHLEAQAEALTQLDQAEQFMEGLSGTQDRQESMLNYKPPWELPGLIGYAVSGKPLFGSFSSLMPALPHAPIPLVDNSSSSSMAYVPLAADMAEAPQKRPRMNKKAEDSIVRRKLFSAWMMVLQACPNATVTGSELTECKTEQAMDQLMEDTCNSRSNATLSCRLVAINLLTRWMLAMGLEDWPPTEQVLYDYVCSCRSTGTAKSRASSLVKAILFMIFTFGLKCTKKVVSGRVQGAADGMLAELGFRRQAVDLPLWLVSIFEVWVAARSLHSSEYVVLGAFLLCLALRARGADLDTALSILVANLQVTVKVTKTKTATSKESRLPLLLIGPTVVASGVDWLSPYLANRTLLGAPFPEYPLFPSRSGSEFNKSRLNNQSINEILRRCAFRASFERASQVSTHSAKATLLSVASQAGMSPQDRAALGYHKSPGMTAAVAAYSRDRLQVPLRRLDRVLARERKKLVSSGDLEPTGELNEADAAVQLEHEEVDSDKGSDNGEQDKSMEDLAADSGSDSDSSSSASFNSQESRESVAELAVAGALQNSGAELKCDLRRFQHTSSMKVHAGRPGSSSRLFCNRIISENYQLLASGVDDAGLDLCKDCFDS